MIVADSDNVFPSHPSPGVQPDGSEHAPGVGRWGRRDDGFLDVASDEMSQTFSVLSWLPLTIRSSRRG